MCINDNGTFKGDIQSVRFGWILVSGSYKFAGETVEFEGVFHGGLGSFAGSKFTWPPIMLNERHG